MCHDLKMIAVVFLSGCECAPAVVSQRRNGYKLTTGENVVTNPGLPAHTKRPCALEFSLRLQSGKPAFIMIAPLLHESGPLYRC